VLAAVATAQLMIGLDLTIMNIALPSAQRSLGLSDPGRQWVITIFALGYGGLLLLGGRLSDLIGRRRSLMIALTESAWLPRSAARRWTRRCCSSREDCRAPSPLC
jgi:MFS family permease